MHRHSPLHIWEKKVIAPIRLDLSIQLIASAASVLYGLLVLLKPLTFLDAMRNVVSFQNLVE